MAEDSKKEWRCQACGKIALEPDLLMAPSPFDPDNTIVGCPGCLLTDGFDEICDEPGCVSIAGCGFPTEQGGFGGYRRTCHKHSNFMRKR